MGIEPVKLAAYAENQVKVTKSRGEYGAAIQWENIAAAAHYLVQLAKKAAEK
jgi:hypothetical protein